MTLWRYILRGFLRSVAGVFVVITLVILLFSVVENVRRLGDTGAGLGDLLVITSLLSTEVLYQVFLLASCWRASPRSCASRERASWW